ncbi:MAG: hypothetical protein KTR30_17915, partial [Saprospiraceae bacterium]|nr:hypothetical protein [Saprospiraceae bacterium]
IFTITVYDNGWATYNGKLYTDKLGLLNETEEAISFRADFMLDEAFQRYFFEQNEALQQQGRASFALGFPLVGKREGNQEILTPLLIWELTLAADPERAQTWIIRQATQQTSFFNRQLMPYTPAAAWEQVRPLVESLERKGQDSPDVLARLCNELAETSHFGLEESAISLGPIPKAVFSLSAEDELHIHWAGVFGNFQLDQYWQVEGAVRTEEPAVKAPDLLAVGPRVLDPWQAAAFEHALTKPETRVNGPEGSGKTYLLMQLLASLVYQQKKVMILAPKVDDLALLLREVESIGLHPHSLLIDNGQTILAELQQKLKDLSQTTRNGKLSTNKNFAKVLSKWQKEKEKLDQLYQASRTATFGAFSRIDTLAFMLRSGRTEGKELLASQLDPKDFEFSPQEMERLSEAIEGSEPLFGEIRTLAHPLNNLNAGIFLHKEKEEALAFIQNTSKRYLGKATELQYAFIRELDQYSDQLMTWHNESYQVLKKELVNLKEALERYQQQFSRDTMESAKTTLKLYGAISKKFQQALAAQEDVQALYDRLEEVNGSYGFFAHTFLEGRDRKLFQQLEENLAVYENSLEQWRTDLPVRIQEEVARLNSKTVHPEVDQDNVLKLETQFDIFLDELNASGLYQLPIQSKTLTFPKRQRFLQECMEQLEKTRLNLRDFNVFFDWQRHWFDMPALARRIVTALVKVRPKSWLAAFESWYFEQCLTANYQPASASNTDALAAFSQWDERVRKGFLSEVQISAQAKRQEGLRRIKQDAKALRDWLKALEPSYEGLLACCDQDLGVLTDIFPLILTTPVEANILFEQTREKLDYLIYWGGSEEVATIPDFFSQLADRVVLFSNNPNGKLGGGEANSLPLQAAYWQSVLDPAFTGKLTSATIAYQYEFVNGRFDVEAEKNEEEAQAILQALNGITANADGQFPSVSIVCFTRGQRNLLLTYLNQITVQSLPGHEHIHQLEAAGLQVIHLPAVSKKQYDIVFVSAVYGQTGVKGAFSDKTEQLKAPAFYAGLQQVRNIPRRECRFYHSIPEKVWKEQWGAAEDPELSLLHLYLTRIQRLSEGQELTTDPSAATQKPDTSFAQEVAWRIAPHISTDRLLLDQNWKSISLPLILLPQQEPQEAMLWLIDGFLAQNQATSYAWEIEQQQQLKDSGYRVQSLSTFDWWKYPEEETEKLLADIREHDRPKFVQEEE